jgi:RNA polymerase sigma factor (sigma-70 family)
MRDDPSVIALVDRASHGDQGAWDELVERYAPLVWSICLRYRLSRPDIDDVGQNVWLRLVEHIGGLREPAALPGWLATTTQRECLRVLHAARLHDQAGLPPEDQMPSDPVAPMIEQVILAAERDAALRAAFAELPRTCRDLLAMLISDPPAKYADISTALGMKVGSIGPIRARCLDRLRRSAHLVAVAGGEDTGVSGSGGERGG